MHAAPTRTPQYALTVVPIIYLDHQAHAPIDPRVLAALNDAYLQCDFNPHSTHGAGERAKSELEAARTKVAALIAAQPAELIMLSGATEANNLAFGGLVAALRADGRTRIIVSAGEHPSVLAAAGAMDGFRVDRVGFDAEGRVELDHLTRLLGPDVGIVSITAANHEIGTVQPLGRIAEIVRASGALFHSDLAQAAGKVSISAADLDLASLSSHKLGGPSGIGALYVRRKLRRRLCPMVHGGGQEGGVRAGTVPVPLCVAFGVACELAAIEMAGTNERVAALRGALLEVFRRLGGLTVNGGMDNRLPGNLNVSFAGVDGEALVMMLRDRVAFSTGSACTSSALEPSHVLTAIGADDRRARGAVRFSVGGSTTRADVDAAADAIGAAVLSLRAMVRRVA